MKNTYWRWAVALLIGFAAVTAVAAVDSTEPALQPLAKQKYVNLQAGWSSAAAQPGGTIALAMVLDISKGHHIQTATPPKDSSQIPTEISIVEPPKGVTVGKPQYPKAHIIQFDMGNGPEPIGTYDGRLIAYLPIQIAESVQPGELKLKVAWTYQACDDRVCFRQDDGTAEVTLRIAGKDEAVPVTTGELFKGFDPSVFAKVAPAVPTTVSPAATPKAAPSATAPPTPESGAEFTFLGRAFKIDSAAVIWLLALVLGVLLNFTPCVLPVVPIKVLSLQQHSGSRHRTLLLGAFFSLGIVACFLIFWALMFGLIGGAGKFVWGKQFSYWQFGGGVGLIMVIMGLGMFGLFTARLPQAVYFITPRQDTLHGSFVFGILTAVLSTPCTGPMFVGASGWALRQSAIMGGTTFAIMGAGMALPYFMLLLFPKWIDKMPRTGPGSELIKQVMGFFMLAVGAWFIGTAGRDVWGSRHWWVIENLIAIGMVWMIYRTWTITKRPGWRTAITLIGVLSILLGWSLATSQTPAEAGTEIAGENAAPHIAWVAYTPDKFNAARSSGKTVVLEFTADWCLTCKALELKVLSDAQVIARLSAKDIVPMRVDLTSKSNEAGWAKLADLGVQGIPLSAIYKPGKEQPTKLDSIYTIDALLTAIGK